MDSVRGGMSARGSDRPPIPSGRRSRGKKRVPSILPRNGESVAELLGRNPAMTKLWKRAYHHDAPGVRGGWETGRSMDSFVEDKPVDFTKAQVPLNYLTTLIHRKIVERTKCPQDQYREAYQMFGSPVGGISKKDFKRHLIRIGVAIGDEDIDRLFRHLDSDNNGAIDFQEMVRLLMPSDYNYDCWGTEAAYKNDTAYIQKAMRLPDPVLEPDHSVKPVDLTHLTNLMYRKILERTKCPQDQYREAYQMFGSPTTGIPFREFRQHLARLGILVSEHDARRLFNKFDLDGNGAIDFKEMVSAVMPDDYDYDCWGVERSYKGDQAYIQRAMRYEDPMGKGIQERLRATQKAKLRNEPTPRYVSLKDALAASQGGRSLTREEMNRAIKHGLDRRGWAPQGVDIEEELLWGRGPAALPYGDGDDAPLITGRRPPTTARSQATARPGTARSRSRSRSRTRLHTRPRTARSRPGTARSTASRSGGNRGAASRPQSAGSMRQHSGRRSGGAGRHVAGAGLAAVRTMSRSHVSNLPTGDAPWRTSKATGGTSNFRVVRAAKQQRELHEQHIRDTLKRQRARQRARIHQAANVPQPARRQGRVVANAGGGGGGGGWMQRAWAGGVNGGYVTAR